MSLSDVPVVILCGGRGMRLGGYEAEIPKPLVEVGGMPILWHVMKIYAAAGCKRFVLCLGYRAETIRSWFAGHTEVWTGLEVAFVDTGLNAETGERLRRVVKFVGEGSFFVGYADGVSDVSIAKLLSTHVHGHRGVATMTCVRPRTHYGIVRAENGVVVVYEEKQRLDEWVNGGFFCFDQGVFEYIKENEMLEREPMQRLIAAGQLAAFEHDGFWACMDTPKDHQALNAMWDRGEAYWRSW